MLEAICSLPTPPVLQAGSSWHPGSYARPGQEDRPRWGAVMGGRWESRSPWASVSPDRTDDRLHSRHDVIHRELTLVALLLSYVL